MEGISFLVVKDIVMQSEKDFGVDAYRNLFIKMYGADVFDYFIAVTNATEKIVKNDPKILGIAKNYQRAIEAIENTSSEIEFIKVYNLEELIGIGRITQVDEKAAKIIDLALMMEDKDLEKDIWQSIVDQVTKYFQEKGFTKMYLEVPIKEPRLLIRAGEKGFVEENILDAEEKFSYLLSKNL